MQSEREFCVTGKLLLLSTACLKLQPNWQSFQFVLSSSLVSIGDSKSDVDDHFWW